MFADLSPVPAIRRPDLLPPSVLAAVAEFVPMAQVFGVDPAHADTETLCQVHDLPLNVMANAVVVLGRRGGEERIACCMTPVSYTHLDVYKRQQTWGASWWRQST